jgi:hypothetical protein
MIRGRLRALVGVVLTLALVGPLAWMWNPGNEPE